MGLISSALFLGSSWLLANNVPPLLFPKEEWFLGVQDISMLGLAGVILSFALGLRLLWAIRKSGNLEQRD